MTTGQARAGARRRQDKGRETGRGWDRVGAAEHTRAGCRPPTLSHTNFKPHKCCVTSALHPRPSSPPPPPSQRPFFLPRPNFRHPRPHTPARRPPALALPEIPQPFQPTHAPLAASNLPSLTPPFPPLGRPSFIPASRSLSLSLPFGPPRLPTT